MKTLIIDNNTIENPICGCLWRYSRPSYKRTICCINNLNIINTNIKPLNYSNALKVFIWEIVDLSEEFFKVL